MKWFRFLWCSFFTVLLLVMAGRANGEPAATSGARSKVEAEKAVSVNATLSSKVTYQGVLKENGLPVSGTRDLTFRLFSDAACTTQIGIGAILPEVPISKGLFTVDVPVLHSHFNGQALWLQIEVDGTVLSAQELLPVPYALSLRPGATIEGTVDEMLVIDNTSTNPGDVDTLILRNQSGTGEALEIEANNTAVAAFATNGYGVWGDSDNHHGVYGRSGSAEKAGVLARGVDNGPDLILAGNADTVVGDNGVITSDPVYASSDITLKSNDGLQIDLDADGDGEDADFMIHDKDMRVIFNIDESGDVTSGGPGIAAFPRPAYDSGWVAIAQDESLELTHNLGGNVDNYVVDLTFSFESVYTHVHTARWGGDSYDDTGAWWWDLTGTTIRVTRDTHDLSVEKVRVRIWMYP